MTLPSHLGVSSEGILISCRGMLVVGYIKISLSIVAMEMGMPALEVLGAEMEDFSLPLSTS